MTNLDNILKSRDITLPTKVCLVKAMVFPVVTYGCESEVTQSCPTVCDPTDGSLLGSAVHGIFQARILEWIAIAFTHPYMTIEKNIALTRWTFVVKVMSLLFNMLSRCHSFSSKEQVSFNFMAAVTIGSDFGAPKI